MSRNDKGLGGARTGLLVLAFATFSAVTTEMLPMGLLPAISSSFGQSEATTGIIVTIYAAAVAVCAVPLTIATRRLPGKRLILTSALVYAASNLLSAFAPTLEVLAVSRFVGGAIHALFFSVVIGYAARLVPPWKTGAALALASSGASAGFIVGVPLSTALGNAVGWRLSFLALVVLLAVTAVLVAWLLPDVRRDAGQERAGTGRKRDLAAVVGTNTLTFLGHYTLYTYVSVLLIGAGAPVALVAPILLLFGALGLGGIWLSGPQLDRRPRLSALAVLGVLGLALIGVGVAFPTTLLVLVVGAVWNMASGPIPSLFQNAAVQTRAASPEIAGAVINASSNIGIAAGAFIGGSVLDRVGIEYVAVAGGVFLLIAVATVLLSRRAFPAKPHVSAPPTTTEELTPQPA